jgi:virginiamycin B lyase
MTNLLQTFFLLGSLGIAASRTCLAPAPVRAEHLSPVKLWDGFKSPTGIAFSRNGRLLVANRSSGEILSIDTVSGDRRVVARSLSLPVGVVEMADGSLVATQYGGRLTRVLPDGKTQELGESFDRPGVGIVADGPDAVLAIDNGAGVVRRVSFGGLSRVVVNGLDGSAVALGRMANGDLLVGTWGVGAEHRATP